MTSNICAVFMLGCGAFLPPVYSGADVVVTGYPADQTIFFGTGYTVIGCAAWPVDLQKECVARALGENTGEDAVPVYSEPDNRVYHLIVLAFNVSPNTCIGSEACDMAKERFVVSESSRQSTASECNAALDAAKKSDPNRIIIFVGCMDASRADIPVFESRAWPDSKVEKK